MPGGNRNLLIAIALTFLILIGFEYGLKPRLHQAPDPESTTEQPSHGSQVGKGGEEVLPQRIIGRSGTSTGQMAELLPPSRDQVLRNSPRITIQTPSLKGSFKLRGAVFDDLVLTRYRETVKDSSSHIVLLSPEGTSHPYQANMAWYALDAGIRLPDDQTLWKADHSTLTLKQPVTLRWNNGKGLLFEQIISVDEHYMFTVTQRVRNLSDDTFSLGVQGVILRSGTPETSGFFISYEGPLGVFNGTLKEVAYKDLVSQPLIEQPASRGWIGMTDKFWLVSLVPNQNQAFQSAFQYYPQQGELSEAYQVFFREQLATLPPHGVIESVNHLFTGAKELSLLDAYEEHFHINHFDLAVDFGWFYFLTKPIFYALDWLKGWTGNFGIAILIFTVLLKLLFFPLANKSYRSMAGMKQLKPQLDELNQRYASDKAKLHQEIWALYKREKVNPVSGCLPMLIQIPVFFALYKVLFVSIEMRHAPFFGWVQDLSAPDPTTVFNLFGLLPFEPPSFLMIGVWPLIMAATMFVQQKLNPPQADPVQQKMFLYVMPAVFTVMLAQFPAGLVIYWAWHNTLTIVQQWIVMRYYR